MKYYQTLKRKENMTEEMTWTQEINGEEAGEEVLPSKVSTLTGEEDEDSCTLQFEVSSMMQPQLMHINHLAGSNFHLSVYFLIQCLLNGYTQSFNNRSTAS